MKISGVYQITCLANNKIYIGSSKNIYYRWKKHKQALVKSKHKNIYLQRSWNLYHEENFAFEILEEVSNLELLIGREQFWLDNKQSYNAEVGFNMCKKAYSTLDKPPSEKCIEVISKEWVVTNLQGDEFVVKNLAKFCRENSLNRNSFKNIGLGFGITYKGWKCRLANLSIEKWNKIREHRMIGKGHFKKWHIIDPDGNEITVINLKKFCRENGLIDTTMRRVALGLYANHKGWKCNYA